MNTVRCRGVTVVLVCALAMALVSAQITFSRDWTCGKRAAPMAIDCGQFTRLCRHFVVARVEAGHVVGEQAAPRRGALARLRRRQLADDLN
ncbi:uncharacterized protein LOC114363366 isoform X1 [Ostrinia furnacalis]|uniref:uncharacterized protein LOC114363366 isoform X1 n=1 Tax=Ostrinia furnacalis TaxID=93504 RepID=UPI00103D35EB|nr:uncharacterized protein LOC114363366 isoform X1 [Ostrinia furnacalis]